jgi:hypothetical protein
MTTKWHDTRKARMDKLFSGKHYEIVEEVKSSTPLTTPLGYKINKGYLLQSGDEKIYVGKALLRQLADEYGAVSKPEPKKRGRPSKTIARAENWAKRDIPDDAQQITQPGSTYFNPNQDQHL